MAQTEASALIDKHIQQIPDWRGTTLARVRATVHKACPAVVEEWKWRGVPVWSHQGILCTGEVYRQVVKLTFAKGASLADPDKLFNSSLEGRVRRAIDLREGDTVEWAALEALVRSAAALNAATKDAKTSRTRTAPKE